MPSPVYPKCPPNSFIYYIKPGDTLYAIAKRFNTTVSAIVNANPGLDTHWLRVAQGICIPRKPQLPKCPYGTFYTIKPGDTLNKIAQKYDMTLKELLRVNPGIDPDRIYVGQTLCIPKQAGGRPAKKKIEVHVEGATEYRNATLKKSTQGYSIYVLDNYTFTAEEPGIDQIFLNNDHRYYMRIQLLPKNANITALRENAMAELKLIGTPDELTGTEIFEPFFRKAKFYLQASGKDFHKEIIVIEIDGRLFRITMNTWMGEALEGVVPSFLAMSKTIEIP